LRREASVAKAEALTHAFLESHPEDAARVLERLVPQEAAALFAVTPLRTWVPALRAMLPFSAARCLELLDDETVAAALRRVGPQSGVALLRHVAEPRKSALLTRLPTALGVAFRLLLGYPEQTVGAHADPQVLALAADATVGAASALVRTVDEVNHPHVYVLDSEQRLLGVVDLTVLLRADAEVPLHHLVRKMPFALPARAALQAINDHQGWNESSALPVVERDGRFVGVLHRAALARSLVWHRSPDEQPGETDVLSQLASAYWLGVSGLIQATVSVLPTSPPGSAE
jgi:magnesium transporter